MLFLPLLTKVTTQIGNHDKTCLNALIVCLSILRRRTVCLNKLKSVVGFITGRHDTAAESHHKLLIRFFDNHATGELWIDLLRYGLQLLRLDQDYLILDGTSWQKGQRWRHLLTQCVFYKGVAIPILWIDLAKQGSSSYAERVALFKLAFTHFQLRDKVLLADREYIGLEWIDFLLDDDLNFVIRSRDYAHFDLIDQAPGKSSEEMIAKALPFLIINDLGRNNSIISKCMRKILNALKNEKTSLNAYEYLESAFLHISK